MSQENERQRGLADEKTGGSSTGDAVVSGMAMVGRWESIKNLVCAIFFSIVFMGVGIYILVRKKKYDSVKGKVISCTAPSPDTSKSSTAPPTHQCVVKYTVPGGGTYAHPVSIAENETPADTVTVYYKPEDPGNATELSASELALRNRMFGGVLIVIGIVVLACAYAMYDVVHKNKKIAAGVGAVDIVSDIFQ